MSQNYNNPHHYLVPQQRIPGYLPYPRPVSPGDIPVPNASSINWPQSQFAPEFFPAGHKSYQDYVYPDYQNDEVLGDLGYARENPSSMFDTQSLLVAAGLFALGFVAARNGWDSKLKAALKSKL